LLDYYTENYRQDETVLAEAQSRLQKLKLLPEQWQTQRFRNWRLARLGLPEYEQERLAEETRQLLATMANSLEPSDGAIFMLNKWTQDEEEIARAFNNLARLKESLQWLPWRRRLLRRWSLLSQLNAWVQHVNHYKDVIFERSLSGQELGLEKRPPSPWWWRLLKHPRRRATLSFLVLPDRLLVMRTGWLSLDFEISPVTRNQARAMITRWPELVRDFRSARNLSSVNNQVDPPSARLDHRVERESLSQRLNELLQFPRLLADLPEGVTGLTMVPDDSLHVFPFAAIKLPDDRYLIERYSLSLAFASGNRRGAKNRMPSREALVVGASELSSCWSANHFILPGRWIIGLAETLCRAGAHSLLGCLWLVDDDLTVAFLKRFYKYCETSARDKALRRAQLDCLRGELDCGVGRQSNPYFGAGYNLYGDYSRLKL